ncbi:ribonuclease HII [Leeuwenhoekiella aequorea]|uniref:ribonuclease HII n=1 Tax=Leeuwenhoekiella aequorea TaxID=283736 RepID=UPI00352EB7F5|tara:strand:+ start:6099 stop:6692 length:594 start_codon:yes stop_codon:yes gene_type:complete
MPLKLFSQTKFLECGTDEAGRGCLAGPVTAAAVILPSNFKNELLTDSKLLSHTKRELLRLIIEEQAVSYSIAHVFPERIDEINILNASFEAMHLAISQLKKTPQHIIVDGNRFKEYTGYTHKCYIKGDSKYMSIAAASILAKTERDRYMQGLHEVHPNYNWLQNKGYPTKAHRAAISKHGPTIYHRKTFKLLPSEIK